MHEDYKKRQPGNSDKNLIRKRTPGRFCIIDTVLFEKCLGVGDGYPNDTILV